MRHGGKVMIEQALAAYAHFLAIFATFSFLAAEAAIYRPRMPEAVFLRLRSIDRFYGIGAGLVIVTGLLRLFFFAKGQAFYAANPIFWVKMALFLAVGLLSLPPTFHFLRSGALLRGGELVLDDAAYRRIRRYITLELALFALIPLAATLMARGIGL
jgi:putative membrane protein